MKKFIIIILTIISIAFVCKYFIRNEKQQLEIELVECVDGDTAWFMIDGIKEKVRLLGIDTPESVHPTKGIEEYGKEASDFTCQALKQAKNIYIEYDINSDSHDKYDRVLGWIFVDNNNLSELLLSKGYANVDYIYGNYKYIDELCIVQKEAYLDKLGIWNMNNNAYEDNYCAKNGY